MMNEHRMVSTGLEHFHFARFRMTFHAEEKISWRPYPGSVLRGAFGDALKSVLCLREGSDCLDCAVEEAACPIWVRYPKPSRASDRSSSARLPYIINTCAIKGKYVEPGQRFAFYLTLIGETVEVYEHLWSIARQMGEKGIGARPRARVAPLAVHSVWDGGGVEVSKELFPVQAGHHPLNQPEIITSDAAMKAPSREVKQITLQFLSPTAIFGKIDGKSRLLLKDIPFHLLLSRLLERVMELDQEYCGGRWAFTKEHKEAWARRAEKEVQLVSQELQRAHRERSSSSQDMRMDLGGVTGEVVYRGNLTPYVPVLQLGEWLHVGKQSAFGNGCFRIKSIEY